jgi:hypothetical protein
MATIVGTPLHAYIAAPLAAAGNSGTQWWTATINQLEAIEIAVDFQHISGSTMSIPAQVNAYLSKDGTTFDSFNNPFMTRGVTRVVTSTEKTTLILPGGYYVLAVCNGTPNTSTVLMSTCRVQTAVVFN